ncbi:MAG: FliG C-terminal domain-containing protein [Anaeromyxobacteraceae bacterium]
MALKGATADVRQKFLGNLSSRAAEMLSDDLAAMGPVKLSSVEAAQQESRSWPRSSRSRAGSPSSARPRRWSRRIDLTSSER